MCTCKIYVLKLPNPIDDTLLANLLSYVSPSRQERIKRFRRREDKASSLFAELLLRFILQTKYLISSEDIHIHSVLNHKPYLENYENIHFNLSHSGHLIALIIGDCENGIDVQEMENIDEEFIKFTCSPSEYTFLKTIPSKDLLHHFFRLWTLKESYVKALGSGFDRDPYEINIPIQKDGVGTITKTVNMNLCNNLSNNSNDNLSNDSAENDTYYFKEYQLNTDYFLSACAKENIFPQEANYIDFDTIIKHHLPPIG